MFIFSRWSVEYAEANQILNIMTITRLQYESNTTICRYKALSEIVVIQGAHERSD